MPPFLPSGEMLILIITFTVFDYVAIVPVGVLLQLVGYRGRARVMVSLVTDTDPPKPHAHAIVGKNANDGRCLVEIGPETDMYAQ